MFFSLWNIYKDHQNKELAFEYLISANKLNRKTIDYSTNDSKRKIHNLINHDYSILKESTMNKQPNIIFIIGMPRSGTSLIEQILSSHSKVVGAGELKYLMDLVGLQDIVQPNKEMADKYFSNITKDQDS